MKILLGDLRHSTIGRHSTNIPLALGYLASYAYEKLGPDRITIEIEDDPETFFARLQEWKPDVVGMSNYCWNAEANELAFRAAKDVNPSVVCVGGGPDFPSDTGECRDYLASRPGLDFFVYQEGELPFADLLERLLAGASLLDLRGTPIPGIKSLHPSTGDLVDGQQRTREKELDFIPSPYLTGLLDKFLDGRFVPFIQTARGCPYHCTYCAAGADWYSKVSLFSLERIKAELDYIAQRVHGFSDVPLAIADSNFGMLKNDEEIAEHIGAIQDRLNWPNLFRVSTGKSQFERMIRVAQKLHNKMRISLSVQSMNEVTLDSIKRKNLGKDEFKRLYLEMQKVGIWTYSDVILPLPHETKESYFNGLRELSRARVERLSPYTIMLLKGTEIASRSAREEFSMMTRFRVVPRQFGTYLGERVFEVEEVCVATNTLSFGDYLDCRGFAFISTALSGFNFDALTSLAEEAGLERFDLFVSIWEAIKNGQGPLTDIYNAFISEATNELFETQDDLKNFYSKDENYQALLNGDIGDNVLRKYTSRLLVKQSIQVIRTGFAVLAAMAPDFDKMPEFKQAAADCEIWMLATRNLWEAVALEPTARTPARLDLSFDVPAWYADKERRPITEYRRSVSYDSKLNLPEVEKALELGKRMFGGEVEYYAARLLDNTPIQRFWRNCSAL